MHVTGLPLVMTLVLVGCGRGAATADRDSLSQRERDSTIGASQLPGAQGVRGALRVSDSAAARRNREDTAGQ